MLLLGLPRTSPLHFATVIITTSGYVFADNKLQLPGQALADLIPLYVTSYWLTTEFD